jgi:hypothetical protein
MDSDEFYRANSIEDVDLNDPVAFEAWREKLERNAETRIKQARERLFRLGVINADGNSIGDEAPIDMRRDPK